MKPPKGAGGRVYPHGRMDVGTGPKPTAAEVAALYPPSPVPQYAKIHDIDDDARWQAEEDAGPTSREVDERITAKLLAREAAPCIVEPDVLVMPIPANAGSGAEYRGKLEPPRIVEPDSIDSADLAARDRPSAADAHAADLESLLAVANARVANLEGRHFEHSRENVARLVKSNATMAESLARNDAERRDRAAQTERPRQHGRIVSLLLWLESDQ